ncbi:DNA polymerase III subunit delta [Patescibacteria group bacterium]|nr:DNA polymerase III subunit delta [Patescibacteria group bacterium]MBU1705775.1 DNA polymerase III subunit delta [Patescibacteria group bacterium]
MLIFIFGEDSFQVQEKVKEMKDAFAKKFDPTGLNTQIFPPEGSDKLETGEILQAACSYPFMSERRLVVIRDLIARVKKDEEAVWIQGLSRIPDSSIVIFWETMDPKALEKKSLFKELKKFSQVYFYPFPELQGSELQKWAAARISSRAGRIDSPALRTLVERVGSDLWQLASEIEKLVALADGQLINQQMIEDNVSASFEGEIFALIDAVANKKGVDALRRLQRERWAGTNDFYLISMLARQVRILLAARSMLDENPRALKQDLADAMALHPFVAQKALQQARAFSFTDLKHTHDLLFEFDWKMKSGLISADLAVDLITTDLLK